MKTLTTFSLFLFFVLNYSSAQSQSNYWTGNVDNEWSNPGNWSLNHVPYTTDSVFVTNANDSVHVDTNAEVQYLRIENGARLDFCTKTLTINGDWHNISSIEYSDQANIILGGNQTQYLIGNHNVKDLTIDNPNGVVISSGNVSIIGSLTVSNGNLETNGNLSVEADSIGNGYIAPILGSITGNVDVHMNFTIDFSDWRFISSPVANATYEDFSDDMWTSGIPGSTYPSSTFISIYNYDETVPGAGEYGYTPPSNIADEIGVGQGVMIYMGSGSFNGSLDFTGNVNNGSVSLPLTYTNSGESADGWNFVGNPMVSAIDWDHSSISKTNLYDAVYIWNPELGAYAAYVDGIGTNGGSNVISTCQSFWVKASGSNPSITIPQEAKTTTQSTFIKQNNNASYMTIIVDEGTYSDETIIRSNLNATAAFDGSYDAVKMGASSTTAPTIYTSMEGYSDIYSINQFPEGEQEVLISVNVPVSGLHNLSFNGVSYFSNNACVILEDLFTGDSYFLDDSSSFAFTFSDTTTVPRFKLKIGAPLFVAGYNASCYNMGDGHINLAKNTDSLFNVTWKDLNGNILQNNQDVYQIATLENLYPGTFIVETTDHLCGLEIDTIFVGQPSEIVADFELIADTVYLGKPATEVTLINQSVNADYYQWDLAEYGTSNAEDVTLNIDAPGTYYFTLFAHQSSTCFDYVEKEITAISTLDIEDVQQWDFEVSVQNNALYFNGPQEYAELIITTMDGKIIYQDQAQINNHSIDLSDVPNQMLVASIQFKDQIKSKKVMIK